MKNSLNSDTAPMQPTCNMLWGLCHAVVSTYIVLERAPFSFSEHTLVTSACMH